jgi:hypothetical protein
MLGFNGQYSQFPDDNLYIRLSWQNILGIFSCNSRSSVRMSQYIFVMY